MDNQVNPKAGKIWAKVSADRERLELTKKEAQI